MTQALTLRELRQRLVSIENNESDKGPFSFKEDGTPAPQFEQHAAEIQFRLAVSEHRRFVEESPGFDELRTFTLSEWREELNSATALKILSELIRREHFKTSSEADSTTLIGAARMLSSKPPSIKLSIPKKYVAPYPEPPIERIETAAMDFCEALAGDKWAWQAENGERVITLTSACFGLAASPLPGQASLGSSAYRWSVKHMLDRNLIMLIEAAQPSHDLAEKMMKHRINEGLGFSDETGNYHVQGGMKPSNLIYCLQSTAELWLLWRAGRIFEVDSRLKQENKTEIDENPLSDAMLKLQQDAVSARLKLNSEIIVKEIIANNGRVAVSDLAAKLEWNNPADNWNSARKVLNKKMKAFGWRFITHGRFVVPEQIPQKAQRLTVKKR